MAFGKMSTVVVLAVVLMSWASAAQAQTSPDMSCVQSLIPCQNFLNGTKPTPSCCLPLKKAFQTQLKCLCDLFNNPELTGATNLNITKVAIDLTTSCGMTPADPAACKNVVSNAPASAPVASPTTTTKAAPPPGKNAASNVGPVSGLVMVLAAGLMLF